MNLDATWDVSRALTLTASAGVARDFVQVVDAEVSPEYNEVLAALTATVWILPRGLRVALGPTFEHRWYDEQSFPDGTLKSFDTFGGKAEANGSLGPLRLRVGYALRSEVNSSASA